MPLRGQSWETFLFCAATNNLAGTLDVTISFNINGTDRSVSFSRDNGQQPLSPIAPPVDDRDAMWADLSENMSVDDDSIDLGIRRPGQRLMDTTVESNVASQTALEDFLELGEWNRTRPTVKAYIDDYNLLEKVRTTAAVSHMTTNKTTYRVHAPESQKIFGNVKRNAEDIKMIVNDAKTQMLCVHDKGPLMKTYINTPTGEKIESGDTLKILGFTFGSTPDVGTNTDILVRKFISNLWSMRYLKQAGMKEPDLLMTYKVMIRPTLDFAACAYHSLLTDTQAQSLERLQLRAMKIACGETVSYRTVVESGRIELLKDRREGLLKKFAIKASKNERFAKLFLKNRDINHQLRRREKYHIPFLRTERAKKSPIIYMRKLLNNMES